MRLATVLLVTVATTVAQNGNFPKLLCNRLNGNFVTCCDNINVEFGRPLEPGDKLTFNGIVHPKYYMNNIHIRDTSGQQILFHTRTAVIWDSPPRWNQLLYTSYLNGVWTTKEFGPNPFFVNQPIQMSFLYTGSAFMVYSGNVLIKQYTLPSPPSLRALFLELKGNFTTNWIQMDCARPLYTRTTKRHRPPRRDSSSSSDEEFCE